MNLKLRLYPTEFRSLITYLRDATEFVPVSPRLATVSGLVLKQYLSRWKPHHVLAWQQRPHSREYGLTLPLPVAKALYEDMQHQLLYGQQQTVLGKLDWAIVNYQDPQTVLNALAVNP